MKSIYPKSEKCIFVGYSKVVKGYKLLQPNSIYIIIKRDVKFVENILTSTCVPSSTCEPSSTIVPPYFPNFFANDPILGSSSDDDGEEENPPLPTHFPLVPLVSW